MRKFFTVLLVAVLAVGIAFAGLTLDGKADATLKLDLDEKTLGYGFAPEAHAAVELEGTTRTSEHEGDVYAKISAEFALVGDGDAFVVDTLEISEASINGENWKIDLAKEAKLVSFADAFAGAFATNPKKPWLPLSKKPVLKLGVDTFNGITIDLFGYKIGIGGAFTAAVDAEDAGYEKVEFFPNEDGTGTPFIGYKKVSDAEPAIPAGKMGSITFAMKPLKLVDEALAINAGFGASAKNGTNPVKIGFGANVAYAKDLLALKLGTDVGIAVPRNIPGAETEIGVEVAAAASYNFISFNAYFVDKPDYGKFMKKPVTKYFNGLPLPSENVLDLKLALDLTKIELPVSLSFSGLDLINDTRNIAVNVAVPFESFKIGASFDYDFKPESWLIALTASYAADFGDLSGKIGIGNDKAQGENNGLKTVPFEIAWENSSLVSGATLSLGYKADFGKNTKTNKVAKIGALTAGCSIAF